jgi:RNA polymerase sigma-70 factor
MASPSFAEFFANFRRQIESLFESSGARQWAVSLDDFARAAWQGIGPSNPIEPGEISRLLAALRSYDLALALGCAQGNEGAWNTFCSEFRSALYEAAYAIVREEGRARELADSLLAELYGLDDSVPGRRSRLAYFHGRSSLKTWLRAVLYQKYVDEYRRQSRMAPLPDEPAAPPVAGSSVSEEEDRRYAGCLSRAVEAALSELRAQEKLLLSYYYVQGLTLKQMAGLAGEHEATVSRHLESLRKKLRKRIETHLRKVGRLSAFEIDRCLDFAARGVNINLERVLRSE